MDNEQILFKKKKLKIQSSQKNAAKQTKTDQQQN